MKRFFALSRIQHAILDIAMPAFCAILWLGGFPPLKTLILALITALCGYISIYSLNDLAGCQEDKKKFSNEVAYSGYSVETTQYHHPLARELLSFKAGIIWTALWSCGALIGSYFLNPLIILVFLLGALLEFIYCRLLKVTYWRFILSGIVKACGPCAAILTVDPSPSLPALLLILAWVFSWEVGGQNIPADFNDQKEDILLGAKTIPVCFENKKTSLIILCSLILTVILSFLLAFISPIKLNAVYFIGIIGIGAALLLYPAMNLYKTKDDHFAAKLFEKASYYPLGLLVWTLIIFWGPQFI